MLRDFCLFLALVSKWLNVIIKLLAQVLYFFTSLRNYDVCIVWRIEIALSTPKSNEVYPTFGIIFSVLELQGPRPRYQVPLVPDWAP